MQDTITPAGTPGPWEARDTSAGLRAPAHPSSSLPKGFRLPSQDIVYLVDLGPANTAFQ